MDALIDRIYEAALRPEIWQDVLSDLSVHADAEGAVLFAAGGGDSNWIASPGLYEHAKDYLESSMPTYDERTARLQKLAHPGFVTDYDVFRPNEFEQDPIIRDFFRPRGLGWGVATTISVPTGQSFIVHCERRFETGPVDRQTAEKLDVYRPHLARAALLSSQFEMMRATATVDSLQVIKLPAAVVGTNGRFLAVNDLMESLVPSVMHDAKGQASLVNSSANQIFQRSIASVKQTGKATVQSIAISAPSGKPPMVVHILPIPRRSRNLDVFSSSFAIIIITSSRETAVLPLMVLESLFDLTPAEAKVARSIASGMQLHEAAKQAGLAVETVRNQLKSVFAKVGVQRQVDLVALIGQLSL